MDNTLIEVFNHDTEETFKLTFSEFLEWFNQNDDIYSINVIERG